MCTDYVPEDSKQIPILSQVACKMYVFSMYFSQKQYDDNSRDIENFNESFKNYHEFWSLRTKSFCQKGITEIDISLWTLGGQF